MGHVYLKKYSRKTRWRDETFEFDILLTKWILSIYKNLKIYNEILLLVLSSIGKEKKEEELIKEGRKRNW